MIFNVNERFKLSDKFLENYKDKQPEWGPLGYLTYKRSYARNIEMENRTEEFWETIKRVVEGCYTIQLNHCRYFKLPWNPYKAQKSAQEMYRLMWEFKFLPPGRGLWAMGSDVVWMKGSASLNNCFGRDTDIFISDDFDYKMVKIGDYVGKTVKVLNGNKTFSEVTVNSYGTQKLYNINFRSKHKGKYNFTIKATRNHRWILSDGYITSDIRIGDKVKTTKLDIAYDNREYESGANYARSFFSVVYNYRTTVPSVIDPELDNSTISFKKGFFDTWVKEFIYAERDGRSIIKTNSSVLKQMAVLYLPVLGYNIVSLKEEKKVYKKFENSEQTNYLITVFNEEVEYIVDSITEEFEDEVFCVEEPVTNSFMISHGIITGNCAFVSTKDIDYSFSEPFEWAMDMSMMGVGVGYDLVGSGKVNIIEPKISSNVIVVDDSKEGWCEAIRVVLDSYVGKAKLPSDFDYSKIRPAGSLIKTFGGIAPGPDPLIKCIDELKTVLNNRINQQITAVDIVDLFNIIGKCVVSGGVRRTALLSLGSSKDEDYVDMKNPEKYSKELKLWRWSSNNSVVVEKNMDYKQLSHKIVSSNGEPGFINIDLMRKYGRLKDGVNNKDEKILGCNPCAEQSLEDRELCCLVEVFPSKHSDKSEFIHTLKYAYLYAKTVTLVPTHCERTNQVMLRNRRIGLSLCGVIDAFEKFGKRVFIDWMDDGYNRINVLDKKYSSWLCIPESIKKTTIKPSGSVSLLPGVSPGIHYPHSEYYIRRIRVQNGSPLIKRLQKANIPNEPTKYNDNTVVFSFPVKSENFKKSKSDVTIWEQLENAYILQYYWSDNCISQTVTVKKEEFDQVADALETFEDRLKSISFLPLDDHGYEQAPYEEITKEQYEEMIKKIKPMDLSNIKIKEEDSTREKFCTGETCELNFASVTES